MLEDTVRVWKLLKSSDIVEIEIPKTHSLDGITRELPHGFYTTFRTYDSGKRVLGLETHLDRLYQPAAAQPIDAVVSVSELRFRLAGLLADYSEEARVRIIMARNGVVFVALIPLKRLPPEIYQDGVKVISSDLQRETPRIKSTAFISTSVGTREIIAQSSIFEALLVRKGRILEGMTSNFFYFMGNKLGTAQLGILPGVTRKTVLRVARNGGVEILYRALKREQVSAVSEAFLTSSSRGIVPIIQIDEILVGEGVPGPVTKNLRAAYQTYVLQHADLIYGG